MDIKSPDLVQACVPCHKANRFVLILGVGVVGLRTFAFVNLLVPSQVGHHREVAPTTIHVTRERFLAGVAVHVGL